MSAQVAADLRAAAEVLERDGWTQGVFTRSDGCRCAAGAIVAAVNTEALTPGDLIRGTDNQFTRWSDALGALADQLPSNNVASWNDTPGRTADEVIAALRAAADAAEVQA